MTNLHRSMFARLPTHFLMVLALMGLGVIVVFAMHLASYASGNTKLAILISTPGLSMVFIMAVIVLGTRKKLSQNKPLPQDTSNSTPKGKT